MGTAVGTDKLPAAPYLPGMRAFRWTLPVVLLAVASLTACDAARDNPLDPQSAAFRDEGRVAGVVTGAHPPFAGLAGVRVELVPLAGGAEAVTRTDAAGSFRVAGLPGGRYAVTASGAAYAADADTVEVAPGAEAEVRLQLDALPVVVRQAARTVHVERWFPETPVFGLEIEVETADPDPGESAGAAVLVASDLGFRAPLVQTAPDRFSATFAAADLPGGQVQSLLGQTLQVELTDQDGRTTLGPPLALVRVIEQTPLTVGPQGYTFIPVNPPTLQWREAQLPFAFTYRVDLLYQDGAGIPNLVLSRDGLPPTTLTLPLAAPLAAGDYYWVVWVVDAAGNRSRSKEAGFRVM